VKWIWVRHGITDENVAGRYIGHVDVPLNSTGICQAEALASRLAQEQVKISKIYTSDLCRAVQTAALIGERVGVKPHSDPALRELSFGQWENRTYEELAYEQRPRLEAWYKDPFTVAPPGGETLQQLGQRLGHYLDEIKAKDQGSTVLVFVTHGGPIRWFQSQWVQDQPEAFWQVEGCKHGEGLIAQWVHARWNLKPLREGVA
jgi:alpha-ribazole phosphatase